MLDEPIRNIMEREKVLLAPTEMSVSSVAKLMAEKNVSAVMVVETKRLVGIFTERDAVFRVMAQDRDPHTTRVADVMTTSPKTVTASESFGYALLMMHENGFRHVPVLENGEPVGIVSARNALDPELEEFEFEAKRRKSIRRQARDG